MHVVPSDDLVEHPAPDPEPESLAIAGVERDTLRDALQRLRPIHREVLILNFMHEIPYRGMAEVLGVPMGTVMSRLHHAKRALRAELERENWS